MQTLQLTVMTTMLAMVAAQYSSASVSASSGDTSNKENDLHASVSSTISGIKQMSTNMNGWHEQQETFKSSSHSVQGIPLSDNSSHRMDFLLESMETSDPISKYLLPKINTDIMVPEPLFTHQESTSTFVRPVNRTTYSVTSKQLFNNKHFESSHVNTPNSSDVHDSWFTSDGSVAVFNSSICFCNQCIVYSDTAVNNVSQRTHPECCYVKQFLNSGHLNTGKLALKVLQQCIIIESRSMHPIQNARDHNNSDVFETGTTKLRELKQANCVLRSLELIYDWRKNYDAVKHNIVGDNDRHFDAGRYRRLLSSLEATLESLPEFLDAASHLDGVGAACLDIIWAPVFDAALGRNRSTFEVFLREERYKLKHTLWTGLMLRNYLDPIVYSLLILFGMLSNGSLLLMFLRCKEMQTQRNVLLLNLVIVDLMNLATVAPLYLLSKYSSPNLYAGEFGCRVFLSYRIIVRYNIEFSLVALTAQRYSAITSHRLSNRTCAIFYILGIWVVSVIATLPHIVAFVLRDFSCFSFRKEPGEIDFLIDHAFMMFLSLIVPAVVFLLSMLMAQRLRRSVREMPGEGRQALQKQEFTRSRSARVVVALAVVFAFTHTPRALWYGLAPWSKIDRQSATFLWIDGTLNYLYYLNSGLNPCAMYLTCSVFRKMFRRYFICFSREYNTKENNHSQRTQQCYISQSSHL